MAWTPAQIKEAKRLFNRKGNRLSWIDCVKRATKGGARKPATKKRASVGAKKRPAATKIVKRKTVVRKSVTRIAGISGDVAGKLNQVLRDISREEGIIEKLRARSLAGLGASDKKAHRTEIAKRKQYVSQLKQHKTAIKRFI